MAKMSFEVMKKGEEVLFINDRFVAIKQKNNDVRLLPLFFDENGLPRIDKENEVIITYGNGEVKSSVIDEDGEVIDVITF